MEVIQYNDEFLFLPRYECFIKGQINQNMIKKIELHFNENNVNIKYKDINDFIVKNYDVKKMNFEEIFTNRCGICLTDLCQLRCNYCAFSSCDNGETIDINNIYAYVLHFFKKVKIFNMVNKTNKGVEFYFAGGGEPTYKWEVFQKSIDFIKKCEEKYNIRATIGLTTNGVLNNAQRNYIYDNINYVLISFDGTDFFQNKNRKTFNGKNTFEVVDSTIAFFDNYNFNYEIRSTIWLDDFVNIKEMYLFLNERYKNLKSWTFGCVMPRGRAIEKETCNINIDIAKIYLDMEKFALKNHLKQNFNFMKFKHQKVGYVCGTSYGLHPWLLPSGSIITCLDGGKKAPVIGSIKNGNIDFRNFNDYIADIYIEKRLNCNNCFAFYHCGAGCPLNNLDSESIKNERYECKMIKKYWKTIYNKLLENQEYLNWKLERHKIDDLEIFTIKEEYNYENKHSR